jgi:hypothetical protein
MVRWAEKETLTFRWYGGLSSDATRTAASDAFPAMTRGAGEDFVRVFVAKIPQHATV